MRKIIVLLLALCLSMTTISTIQVKAISSSEKLEVVEISDETYIFTTNISEGFVTVESTSENGEYNIFTYDKEADIATLNGRIIQLSFEKYIDPTLQLASLNNMHSDPYTPVYVASYNSNFSDIVTSVGAIATVIGGVIAVASLSGIALPAIAGKIGEWASAVGLGSLVAGELVSGTFSYQLYRTSGPVQFGVEAWPLIAYRYQNCSVNFSILGKTMFHAYGVTGSWFYTEKPY